MKKIKSIILVLSMTFAVSCMDMYNDLADEFGEYNYFLAVGNSNSVLIYTLNSEGVPTLVHTETIGGSVYGMAVHPNGDFIYVPDNVNDKINAYFVNKDGTLKSLGIFNSPSAINLSKAIVHPSGKYLYVSSQSNVILMYNINSDGKLTSIGTGYITASGYPNKMAIHPSGKYLYVTLSSGGGVSKFDVDENDGSLNNPQTKSLSQDTYDVTIHPNGSFIYASGAANSLIYKCDIESDGTIGSATSKTIGAHMQLSFILSPDGDYIYIKEGYSSSVYAYAINSDGSLASTSSNDSNSISSGSCNVSIHPNNKYLYITDIGGGNRLYYNIVLKNNSTFNNSVTIDNISNNVQSAPFIIRKKK